MELTIHLRTSEVSDLLTRMTVWAITDVETADRLLGTMDQTLGLECTFAHIRKLDITLRLPMSLYEVVEVKANYSAHQAQDARNPTTTDDVCHAKANMWLRVCGYLPQLQKLTHLRLWLDHDETKYWAKVDERSFVSPVVAALKTSKPTISVHLPELNPGLEDAARHYLSDSMDHGLTIVRRTRQRHHGYVNSRGRLLVTTKLDFPMLRVGDYPFEDLGEEELRVAERRMWKRGSDVEHEIVNGGTYVHRWSATEWDEFIEPEMAKREKELCRSLKWPEDAVVE
jgi:hypothetical protein